MATSVLQEQYKQEVFPRLFKEGGYTNQMQVPRVTKIVINTGVGTSREKEALEEAVQTLSLITGQKPVVAKARKSVSQFKLRAGMPVGVKVTLRRTMMYNFLYRLINIVLPRVRDFRGISANGFDGRGNYSLGLSEQSVFTEVNLDKMKHTIGMNISIITTAETDKEAYNLLRSFGMPFAGGSGGE